MSECKEELEKYLKSSRFDHDSWTRRGLNPSSEEICHALEKVFNAIASTMLEFIGKESFSKECKSVLKNTLKGLRRYDFDTEESEFICDELDKLAKIVGVNISRELNIWLYGALITYLLMIFDFFKKFKR